MQHNLSVEKSNDEINFKINPEKEKKQQGLEEFKSEYEDL